MITLQVVGRNIQALDGSLLREGWLARLAAPFCFESPNKKTGAPAGMERVSRPAYRSVRDLDGISPLNSGGLIR